MSLFRLLIAVLVGIAVWTIKVSLLLKVVIWFGITAVIYTVLNIVSLLAAMAVTREA